MSKCFSDHLGMLENVKKMLVQVTFSCDYHTRIAVSRPQLAASRQQAKMHLVTKSGQAYSYWLNTMKSKVH